MSKRIIIVPDRYYKDTWYDWIFNKLYKDLNFKLCCWSESIPSDVGIVIAFGFPHFNWRNDVIVNELVNLDSSIRLVYWTTDLHCGLLKIHSRCKEDTIRMFDRCDLIISSHDGRMKKEYVEYLDKYVYVPWCFAPHERYMKFKINEHPRMQCLQVGASNSRVYPLRNKIKVYARTHNQIHYVKRVSRESYPGLLYQYFCGIVDIGHYNEVVQPKYFEIPAVGSLLLGRRTNLIDDLGFIPHKHYVPFAGDDVFAKANEILSNPDKYEGMRRTGMDFVRKNHNLDSRMKKVYDALRGLL